MWVTTAWVLTPLHLSDITWSLRAFWNSWCYGKRSFFLWLKSDSFVAHEYYDFYSFECTQNQLYMLYKISKIVLYVYVYTDLSSQEKIIFPVEAYFLQVTKLPPFCYVWPSHKPVKENQFTKSAKKKKLKQRRQLSGTGNAVLKLLKQHQL